MLDGVFGRNEIKELIIGDLVLSFAFSMALLGGLGSAVLSLGDFLYVFPIAISATTLVFVLHELMHKFVAQHFGAIAAFRTSMSGLAITLMTGFLGFLFGVPGATFIYTNTLTKKENGYISLAGPLVNFVVFGIVVGAGSLLFGNFFGSLGRVLTGGLGTGPYLENALGIIAYISIWLAFFNMLPVFPLDGSKVLAWSKPVYAAMIIATFACLALLMPVGTLIVLIIIALVMVFLFSMFYKGILMH